MTDAYGRPLRKKLNCCVVFWNVLKTYYRTIIGIIGAVIIFSIYAQPFYRKRKGRQQTLKAVWLTSIWFLVWLPIPVQAIGFLSFFAIPFMGVLSCDETIFAMFNEMILLMIIGSYLSMLLNCSGIDRRLACHLLCIEPFHTATSLASRTMMAAFFLSMISNRMIVTCLLIDMVVLPLDNLADEQKAKKYSYILNKFDYESFQAFLCNAITTSATIGSICIQHHNITLMQFRAIFAVSGSKDKDYPDIFNYLTYSVYSFPTAILMFLVNYCYHMRIAATYTMSKRSVIFIKNNLKDTETTTVRVWDCHQVTSVICFILMMLMFMTRWCKWLNMGWATRRPDWASPEVPGLKDATTAAFCLIIFHLIPNTCEYFKECKVKYIRDLPTQKVASGLLFWKKTDFYTEYAVLFMIGSGLVILQAARVTKLDTEIWKFCEFHQLTQINDNVALLELLVVYVISIQFINGIGAQALSMPFILLSSKYADLYWPRRLYVLRTSLGIGISSSFSFMTPHKHNPCYYSRKRAHVSHRRQMKYGIGSIIICLLLLYLTLCIYARFVWDPQGRGLYEIPAAGQTPKTTSTTTETPITTTKRMYWWWSDEGFH